MGSRVGWLVLSLITGIIMIALGIIFLARPGLGLATVILWFGILAIAHGIVLVLAGLAGRRESRGWAVVEGLFAIVAGVVVLAWPGLSALTALYIVATWMIVSGVVDVIGAFGGGQSSGQRLWLLLTGLVAVVVGIVFFIHPAGGVLAMLWLVGIYLVALGVLRILYGFAPPPERRPA